MNSRKLNGNLKKVLLGIIDIFLFFIANASICFFITNGHIFNVKYSEILFNYLHFFIMCFSVITVNTLCGLYRSVWTYAGTDEAVSCTVASFVDAGMLFVVDKLLFKAILGYSEVLPFYAYILDAFFLIFVTCLPRLGYRVARRKLGRIRHSLSNDRSLKRVMIVGAGYMGNAIIEDLKENHAEKYKVVVAIDDNPAKKRKRINHIKIAGNCNRIPEIAEKYEIDEIIICIPSATKARLNEIMKIALQTGKKIKISPSLDEMLENNSNYRKIKDVDITDLLSRDEVKLDIKVCKYLIDKTILVTGGGGSIGSELCMQCARYQPKKIIIFDIYENTAFELAGDLKAKYGDTIDIQIRIGSVRDVKRLEEVFNEFQPDVVFHAAAHKHVPLMEDSPCEAVKNNVFGTYNVAVTADKFKVSKMVILSTDKAVNPTNVMGTTKRITEIIVQYMNEKSKNTKYAAVRFGNVLGSHGSVIPIFKKQIANGGPVSVTHPDITRYFMTIPEAAQLVCQAGGLANGGEVFVLDMGEPVKIMDLAENLIKLSGFSVDEIGIKITGLRPGEKLYEELSMDDEMKTREKTANEKIFVNQPMVINSEEFENMLNELEAIDDSNVREKLRHIVPNYHPAKN